jgi:hypothetical protein
METVQTKATNPTVEGTPATGEPISAIPISVISGKVEKKKRSKKTGEKKKSKKNKSLSSSKPHTMTSLYLDPLNDQQNVESVKNPKSPTVMAAFETLGQEENAKTIVEADKVVSEHINAVLASVLETNVESNVTSSPKNNLGKDDVGTNVEGFQTQP